MEQTMTTADVIRQCAVMLKDEGLPEAAKLLRAAAKAHVKLQEQVTKTNADVARLTDLLVADRQFSSQILRQYRSAIAKLEGENRRLRLIEPTMAFADEGSTP